MTSASSTHNHQKQGLIFTVSEYPPLQSTPLFGRNPTHPRGDDFPWRIIYTARDGDQDRPYAHHISGSNKLPWSYLSSSCLPGSSSYSFRAGELGPEVASPGMGHVFTHGDSSPGAEQAGAGNRVHGQPQARWGDGPGPGSSQGAQLGATGDGARDRSCLLLLPSSSEIAYPQLIVTFLSRFK